MAPPVKKPPPKKQLWAEKVKEGEQIKIFYILKGEWKGEELLKRSALTPKCCNDRKWKNVWVELVPADVTIHVTSRAKLTELQSKL